jgi:hypothetical protein
VPSATTRPLDTGLAGRRGIATTLLGLAAMWLSVLPLPAESPSPPAPAAPPAPTAAPTDPAPRLEVDALEVQLGEIVRGQKVEAGFELRNAGEGTLRIERAKPG